MSKLINIRSDKFSKREIQIIEESIKEWGFDWMFDIVYMVESNEENPDVTFILKEEYLAEFVWVIFGCGHEYVYKQ